MNWTGGRLQRNSKANANAQIKAQKDYFARARLRQNTKASAPSLLHLSPAAPTDQQPQTRHSLLLSGSRAAVDEGQSLQGRRRSKIHHATYKSHATNPLSTIRQRTRSQSSHGTTPPRVNTLEHVKRSLLKQPDWLGLAGTRPPKPEYPSTTVLDQVGRRRRVTREDRQRQKHVRGQRKIEHNFIKPFAGVDDASAARPSSPTNLSIRVGSNIHQSQPIRSGDLFDNLGAAVPNSSSTEPMLLDMVEARDHAGSAKPGEYYLVGPNDADDTATGLNVRQEIPNDKGLVSLEDVRNFPSFDEVKRYSSSTRNTVSSPRSVSKQPYPEASGLRHHPVHHTSSSFVHGRPVDDHGLFSSDSNNYRLVSIGSEPPVCAKVREDSAMQDTGADIATEDTESASQESREFRFRDTHREAPQKSSPVFGHPKCGFSPLASVAVDARARNDFQDAHHRKILFRGHPRAIFTIDEQVWLEESRKQQSNRLVPPANSRSVIPIVSTAQIQRLHRRQERESAYEKRRTPTRYVTPEAEEKCRPNEHAQSFEAQLSSDGNRLRSQSDENEAWMRDVFCTDFEKLQQRFSYAKAPSRSANYQTPPRNMIFGKETTEIFNRPELPEWRRNSPQYFSESSLPKTIKTGANTVLNVPSEMEHDRQRNIFMPSETGFLEQMSPMTDYLDERVANLSTYNNAAHTVRDFVDQRHTAAKRTASDAFSDNSYDQYIVSRQSEGKIAQTSPPAPHRVPLHTLYQAPVRSHPIHEVQAIHEDTKLVSRPIWRHAEAPSMVSSSTIDRARGQRELPSRIRGQVPSEYSPVRMSAGQPCDGTRGGTSRQGIHTATPQFSSQVSPTQSSEHRIPLNTGLSTQTADLSYRSDRNHPHPTMDRNLTPLVQHGTSTPFHSAGLAPASSSSAIPTHNTMGPVGNFHANQAQHFAFTRSQRPTAQYAHPSKIESQFRAPPSISLPLH